MLEGRGEREREEEEREGRVRVVEVGREGQVCGDDVGGGEEGIGWCG